MFLSFCWGSKKKGELLGALEKEKDLPTFGTLLLFGRVATGTAPACFLHKLLTRLLVTRFVG